MQSRSYLFLGIVLVLAVISGVLFSLRQPNWGLDIRGGVQLDYQMVGSKGKPLTPQQMADARDRTASILQTRAGKNLGVVDAVVQEKGADQFIVDLPSYQKIDEAKAVMGTSARILFYDAKNVVTQAAPYRDYDESSNENSDEPEVDFRTHVGNTLITPRIPDPKNPNGNTVANPAYAAVIAGWGDPIVQGDELTSADMAHSGGIGNYIPEMHFNAAGAAKMHEWSIANNQRGEMLAAVLDGTCISIAPIKQGADISDECVIEGTFKPGYVKALVDELESGALPVDLQLASSSKLDPTIGQNALNMIFTAGVIAAIAIAVFMLIYYEFPGFVAVLALALYILFTLTVLKLIEATFSLPAIAGFILSVGMAVDANILIFERMKEEMRAGKDLQRAFDLGFKRALSAIIDSNACTILTAIVLLNFGTGPVKGFATTLIIGVAISFFTAVTITRSLLEFFIGSGIATNTRWYGLNRQWFGESLEASAKKKPLQIVNKAGRYFLISGLTIVPGILFLSLRGLKGNVEFTGGTEITYRVPANVTSQQIESGLTKGGIPGASVILGATGNDHLAYLTIPPNSQIKSNTPGIANKIAAMIGIPPQDAPVTTVGGTVQKEVIQGAIYSVIFSTILVIVYLSIRFGAMGGVVIGWRFAASTVLALFHDILVVIGLAALMGYLANWQVSALFVSAMLTVIGFSTHDTIVIFDRIRENLHKPEPGEDSGNLINRSITQSIARSINTSMTVIATLALLIGVGSATPELKLFNLAMLVGIISGTYSSIFNASPILYLWDKAIEKRNPQRTLLGIANQHKVRLRAPAQEVTPQPRLQTSPAGPATQSYGQVRRRRASDVERSRRTIDDEE